MKDIGVISGIVVIIFLIIFVAYTKKWDKEEIERKKTATPKPEIKNSKFQALLFIIFIVALILAMLFLNTGGSLDWFEDPRGFAE